MSVSLYIVSVLGICFQGTFQKCVIYSLYIYSKAMESLFSLKGCLTRYMESSLIYWGFPGAQMVKNLPSVRETWVRSLGWEDSLEEEMATHSSILALENPHGQRSLVGCKESDTTERLSRQHSYTEYPLVVATEMFISELHYQILPILSIRRAMRWVLT